MAGASAASSGDAYGSMVVSALAEAVSKGGGIGLAEVIARAASQEVHAPNAAAPASAAAHSAPSTAPDGTSASREVASAATKITVPHHVRITTSPAPISVTYPRPAPAIIINQNHDIQDSFKDRNR
jgi:Rod binding domain-containing protein